MGLTQSIPNQEHSYSSRPQSPKKAIQTPPSKKEKTKPRTSTPEHKNLKSAPPLPRNTHEIIIVDVNDNQVTKDYGKPLINEPKQASSLDSTCTTSSCSALSSSLESKSNILEKKMEELTIKRHDSPEGKSLKKEIEHSSPTLDQSFKEILKPPLKIKDTKSQTKETLVFNLKNTWLNSYYDSLILRAGNEDERRNNELDEKYIKYRKAVIEWMIEVGDYFQLDPITTHFAINMLDKIQPNQNFSNFNWQMIAIANILIASKFNENAEHVPNLHTLEEITQQKINNNTLLNYELWILKNISWRIDDVLPISLLSVQKEKMLKNTTEKDHKKVDELFKLAFSFNEKIILNYQFNKFEVIKIAALSLFLAVKNSSYTPEWNKFYEELSQTSTQEIKTFIQTHQELVNTLTNPINEENKKEKTESTT